jgi:hypothetical protein
LPLHIWLYDQVKLKLEALQEEEKEAEEEEAEEEEALEEAEEEKYDPLPADFRRYHDGARSPRQPPKSARQPTSAEVHRPR